MDDGLASLVREISIDASGAGISVNGHSYPFTLSAAESHADLGSINLGHGKTRRARIHYKYAITDFADAGEYERAHQLAK